MTSYIRIGRPASTGPGHRDRLPDGPRRGPAGLEAHGGTDRTCVVDATPPDLSYPRCSVSPAADAPTGSWGENRRQLELVEVSIMRGYRVASLPANFRDAL